MAQLAVPLTLASAGLSVASGVAQGSAAAAGYRQKENQAKRTEFAARVAADQTSAALSDELNVTLGNIDAIRAAAGVGDDSPTGQAIRDRQIQVSGRERGIRVGNLRSQADQAASDAEYFGAAQSSALGLGWLTGLAGGFGKLSSLGGSREKYA